MDTLKEANSCLAGHFTNPCASHDLTAMHVKTTSVTSEVLMVEVLMVVHGWWTTSLTILLVVGLHVGWWAWTTRLGLRVD